MVDDRTARIASQYKKLFRLPSTRTALILMVLISVVISLPFYLVSPQILNNMVLTSCILFSIIAIAFVDMYLTAFSPISSFRRILFSIYFQLFPLIILSICSFFLLYFNLLSSFYFLNVFLLATGYIISIRFFLLRIFFFQTFSKAIVPTLIFPVSIYIPTLFLQQIKILPFIMSICIGFLLLGCTIIYIKYINQVGLKLLKIGSIDILVSYLTSWICSIPDDLEAILERHSISSEVRTDQISLRGNSSEIILIVPGIHPGPFAPIGSYNLPADIINFFKKKSITSMVFHSPSLHAINLPSKKEVGNYLESLVTQGKVQVAQGNICSKPLKVSKNKATVTGIMFDDVIVAFLSLSPYGVEDLPPEISDYVKQFVDGKVVKDIILIDSHNSLGTTISDQDLNDLKEGLKLLIERLRTGSKYNFKFSFTDFNATQFKEVGEGGISCLCLLIENDSYLLYSIDANNAVSSFKSDLEKELNNKGFLLLEICTTDSHFSSGKMNTKKGYYVLGELSEERSIIRELVNLATGISSKTQKGWFEVNSYSSQTRTLGQIQIDLYSRFLHKVLSSSRRGAITIVIMAILMLTIFVVNISPSFW